MLWPVFNYNALRLVADVIWCLQQELNIRPCYGPILVLTLFTWWLLMRSSDNDNKKFRVMPWPDFSSDARRLVAAEIYR